MNYEKLTLGINGRDVAVDSVRVNSNVLIVTKERLIRLATLRDELYEDVDDPALIIKTLKDLKPRPDLFTFWQRLPETDPKYDYDMQWESLAALPIKSYDDWFQNQISQDTRKLIRRAEKKGCVIRKCTFDDQFINGMSRIFNESPIRQGVPFRHYGKDHETIRREFSRYLFREELFGAFFEDQLIGFIFLAHAENYAFLGQILSKIEHRDKYPNNALIAKAVEVASMKGIPFLVYGHWSRGGLDEFKRRNGFQKMDVPRYFVPLTLKGELSLKLKAHHGFSPLADRSGLFLGLLPDGVKRHLRELRRKWHDTTGKQRVIGTEE